MATNHGTEIRNSRPRARNWATSCAKTKTAGEVTAKRLEIFLTMQRQYAEQLKLSHALSERLDAMASQASLLQNVLNVALEKLGPPNEWNEPNACDVAPINAPSSQKPRPKCRAKKPNLAASSTDRAAMAAASRSPRWTASQANKPAEPPGSLCFYDSGDEDTSRVVSDPLKSPRMSKILPQLNAAASGAYCQQPPPTTQPPLLEPLMSTFETPSLPAAPPSSGSTAAVSWSPPNDTPTVSDPCNSTVLPEVAVACSYGQADQALVMCVTAGAASASSPCSLGDEAATLGGASGSLQVAATHFTTQSQGEHEQVLLKGQAQAQKREASRGSGDDGSSGGSRSGGGPSGSGNSERRVKQKQRRQQHGMLPEAFPAAMHPSTSAAVPAAIQAAPTALHNPLVFRPSYFSNPYVVQALQLQGGLRREVPLVQHLVRQAICASHQIQYFPGSQTTASSANTAQPGGIPMAYLEHQAYGYGTLASLQDSSTLDMQVAASNPASAAFPGVVPSTSAAAAAMGAPAAVPQPPWMGMQTPPYSNVPAAPTTAAADAADGQRQLASGNSHPGFFSDGIWAGPYSCTN